MWRAARGTGIGTERERESHGAGEREAGTTRLLNAHAPTFLPEAPAHSRNLTALFSTVPSASVVTSFPIRSETRRSPRTPATPGFTDLTRPAMTTGQPRQTRQEQKTELIAVTYVRRELGKMH